MARFSADKDVARGCRKEKTYTSAQFNRGDQVDQLAEAGSLGWMVRSVAECADIDPGFTDLPPPPFDPST